ncbi:Competence protein A [Planctomycetes bacterium MalM25]|nr:Competence protein A [Planctomycetes bacterium MalM25]
MAKSGAAWGIDIGQSALKALRCRPHESDDGRLVVEAFDYIEYPKLLSQPDADPEELVREALATFLERNELKGDRVAVSVPGQAGLARFIKLPPVEAKKIPDIVKYEARQQIPFQLEDVVWDYQPLAGGSQDEGFALETEIGLFAMKRDQVARSLDPLTRAGVEVDYIQLAPLALYNYCCFDNLPDQSETVYDPENPPPSVAVLSLGVDTTDLVITNGFRVWQRSIQIGGSHFTKALTKELKLTFSKAEHLKKNAAKAEDPKAVFQAMRPVFSDLVAEIQRSIGFCTSNNAWAQEISEIIAVGNAMKLPGLQRYLAQNLEAPVKPIEEFEALAGGSVTAQPVFQQNHLSFPVAYGLCVQALDRAGMSTNLLPDEIITQRLIRAKKPWAVAAAAALMLGLAVNYNAYVSACQTVDPDEWKSATTPAQSFKTKVGRYTSKNGELVSQFETVDEIGVNLASNVDGRLLWPELWTAIRAAIPQDDRPEEEREQSAEDVTARRAVHITSMDSQQYDDLATWYATVSTIWSEAQQGRDERAADEAPTEEPAAEGEAGELPEEGAAEESFDDGGVDGGGFDDGGFDDPAAAGGAEDPGPTGPGWVIQLRGYHFHNARGGSEGRQFVRETLIENLINGSVPLPDGAPDPDDPEGKPSMLEVTFKELGISHPVVITKNRVEKVTYDPNAGEVDETGGGGMRGGGLRAPTRRPKPKRPGLGRPGAEDEPEVPENWELRRYDFIVQFAWSPTMRVVREQNRQNPDGVAEEETDF